jgi:hypothetical protein
MRNAGLAVELEAPRQPVDLGQPLDGAQKYDHRAGMTSAADAWRQVLEDVGDG